MSTNFYWTPSPTGKYKDFSEIHIGKRSGGWSFSFQAVEFVGSEEAFSSLEVAPNLRVPVRVPALPAISVKSFDDWEVLLREEGGVIRDEYDDIIATEEFISMVSTDLAPHGTWGPAENRKPLLNHFDELVKNEARYGKVDRERNWKDAKGYSFSANDFS